MLVHVKIPNEKFNGYVKDGSVGKKIKGILDETKPEAVYFTEYQGKRGAIMLVNVPDPTAIPAIAEPWFVMFDAEVEFHIVMSPADLEKSGIDNMAKKWA